MIVIVGLVGVGILLSSRSNPTNQDQISPQATEERPTEKTAQPPSTQSADSVPSSAVKEFTVTGSDFKFDIKEIRVKKGDTVKITFKNAQGFHDFTIDTLNVGTRQISQGTEDTVQFVAQKEGSFEYYCSVANHRAIGMKGMLVVE